jgi:hypothetical protein
MSYSFVDSNNRIEKNFYSRKSNGLYENHFFNDIFGDINSKKKKKEKTEVKKEKAKKITIIFPKDMSEETKEVLQCPISLELMLSPTKTTCQHIFDMKNINEWIKKNDSCPVCRSKIVDIDNLNLKNDNVIINNLEKIKIKYGTRIYSYKKFVEKIYNYSDNFVFDYK